MSCPACKHPIRNLNQYPQIQTEIQKVLDLEAKVSKLAEKVIEKEKIDMAPT